MQFFVEVLFLLILFFLLKKILYAVFPPSKLTIKLSKETRVELRRFYRRYIMIFLGLGVLFTLLFVFAFRFVFDFLHNRGGFDLSFGIDNYSLLLPAAVFGFLVSNFFSDYANEKLQKDGLAFFLQEIQDDWQGVKGSKLRPFHLILVCFFGSFLLYLQYQVYFKIKDEKVYYTQTGVQEVVIDIKDFDYFEDTDNKAFLHLKSGDTIFMHHYHCSKSQLLEFIE